MLSLKVNIEPRTLIYALLITV